MGDVIFPVSLRLENSLNQPTVNFTLTNLSSCGFNDRALQEWKYFYKTGVFLFLSTREPPLVLDDV